MNQDNRISLIDLFAFFIRKFWFLFVGALVGMVLILSGHIILSNTTERIEAYNERLSSFKENLSSLESLRDNYKLNLKLINDVESFSPIFSDGMIFVSKIIITIDSDSVVQTNTETGNSIIGHELSSFWSSLDLASTVGSDSDNDILSASIIFEQSGQSASIRVYSEDRDEAEKYAAAIVDAFVSYFDTREHLSIGSKAITTSIASKSAIVSIRDPFVTDKNEFLKKCFDTEVAISTLKKDAPSKYHPLRYAVIGFFVGGVAVAFLLCVIFITRNPFTSSFNVEKELDVPFLGAFFTDNGILSKLSRKTMGERLFKNKDDSVEYLKGCLSSKSFNSADVVNRITLISSLKNDEVDEIADNVKTLLKDVGLESIFLDNSLENPLAIKTIENSGAVILLEKQWISRIALARINKNLASKMNKKVLGFIIC